MAYTKEQLLQLGAKPVFESQPTRYTREQLLKLGAKPVVATKASDQKKELDKESAKKYGASFPASTVGTPSALDEGFKTVGNIPSSAYNLAKGFVKAPFENLKTLPGDIKNIRENIGDLADPKKVNEGIVGFAKMVPRAAFETLVPEAPRELLRAGGKAAIGDEQGTDEALQQGQRALTNDPVGSILPFIGAGKGIARAIGKEAAFEGGISKVAEPFTGAAQKVADTVSSGVKGGAKFLASQASGLAPETISTIMERPNEFQVARESGTSRVSVANKVKKGLDKRIEELSSTGTGYQKLRESQTPVVIPKGTIQMVLAKYGLGLKKGKIILSAESVPLSPGDVVALERFIDQYGKQNTLSVNGFLNARKALDLLAEYDATKTDLSNRISRDLRKTYDTFGKPQVRGLTQLDEKYSTEVQALRQLKQDYLNPDGSMKDGAINKIANLTGKGKNQVLARLEEAVPGITEDINIVKALEDIEASGGAKVGTYARGGVLGGAVATGNLPALLAAIITSPSIFVPLLQYLGRILNKPPGRINRIINLIKEGSKLSKDDKAFLTEVLSVGAMLKAQSSSENETPPVAP